MRLKSTKMQQKGSAKPNTSYLQGLIQVTTLRKVRKKVTHS